MKDAVGVIDAWALLFIWSAGIVIAKGVWSTAFAVCFPPWAVYLLVERCLILLGIVAP